MLNDYKRGYGFVLCLFLLLFVVACSGSAEPTTEPVRTVEEPEVQATAEVEDMPEEDMAELEDDEPMADMRTVTDVRGEEIEIPANPQRVVALSERDMDAALALGAPVVGVVNGRGSTAPPTYLQSLIGDEVTVVGPFFAPNAEVILGLEPDLIIIGCLFPDLAALVPSFEEVAPVVVTYNCPDSWQDAFMGTADALNMVDEAEAWMDAYNGRVEMMAAETAGQSVSIVRFNPEGPIIMSPISFASQIASSVGLVRPEAQQDIEGPHSDIISEETLKTLEADHLFVGALNPEGAALIQAAASDPLYVSLDVLARGDISIVDGAVWTSLGGPLAAQAVLDDIAAVSNIMPASAVEPEGDTSSEDADAEMAGDSFPLTIDHKYGSTTIPEKPVRVVSVGYSDQDELLALGVVPVGLRDWYGEYEYAVWPWAQDELGDAEPEIIASGEINFEAVAALNPDIIVGLSSGMTQEEYDLLSQIAPTVAQPGEYVDYGTPWQEATRIIGRAVGESEMAEELVRDTENRFADVRENHPEFDGAELAVAFWFNEQPGAYASQDTRPRLLSEFGFVTPEVYDEMAGDSFYTSFSEEEMATLLDVDLIVWIASSNEEIEIIRDQPLRDALTAAQEGREVFLNKKLGGAFSFSSALSLDYLLDELVPMLEAAIDGDPETVPGG